MPPGRQLTKVCTARHDPQPPLLVPSATCVKGLGFFSSSAVSWQFEITALVGSAERTGTGTRVPSARDATHALEMASVYGPLCFQPGLDSGEKAHGECDRSRREVGRPLGGNARPRPRPPPSLELYRGWRSSRALRIPALRPVSPALKRPQQCAPAISCTPADESRTANEWNGVDTDTLKTDAYVDGYCTSSGPE